MVEVFQRNCNMVSYRSFIVREQSVKASPLAAAAAAVVQCLPGGSRTGTQPLLLPPS